MDCWERSVTERNRTHSDRREGMPPKLNDKVLLLSLNVLIVKAGAFITQSCPNIYLFLSATQD